MRVAWLLRLAIRIFIVLELAVLTLLLIGTFFFTKTPALAGRPSLVGVWIADTKQEFLEHHYIVKFSANGQFREIIDTKQADHPVHVWGAYSVTWLSSTRLRLHSEPYGFDPEVCIPSMNLCVDLDYQPDDVVVEFLNSDTVTSSEMTFHRTSQPFPDFLLPLNTRQHPKKSL